MAVSERRFKEGQLVRHKGRRATFLYYIDARAAVIRFSGRRESNVVSASSLSAIQGEA
jgi:hypothetical protein